MEALKATNLCLLIYSVGKLMIFMCAPVAAQ